MKHHFAPRAACVIAAIFVASCAQDRPTSPTSELSATAAPRASSVSSQKIPGEYIVRLRDDVANVSHAAAAIAGVHGGTVGYVYTHAIKGFSIRLPDAAAAALAQHSQVLHVEQNETVHAITTQSPATWGIDRVDQQFLPLDNSYTYTGDGTGVTAYIIDTGIRFDHVEFGGRAVPGVDEVTLGGNASDCNGHGTHVSGTVGGSTYGLAKNVRLVAVRVLDCNGSGSWAGVMAGIDWVTGDHVAGAPAVANMSLGGGFNSDINNALHNSVNDGVVYAVAAGNSSANACNSSPASEPSALTVAASTSTDGFASFSNFGSCVDIIAPGVSITSAWNTSSTATNTISGTSMASPHVAGAAVLYLSANPGATPAQVASGLTTNATPNVISGVPAATPNLLLYTGFMNGPPPPPPSPPADPSGLTATAVSSSQINLAWADNSNNESGFRIERCTGAACTGFAPIATTGAGATSYSNTGLSASTLYRYRVVAFNSGGDSGPSNEAEATTQNAPPNQNPTARFSWNCRNGSCNFNGTSSSDPDGNIASYSWDFGDGTGSTLAAPSHDYGSRGVRTVTLTVTDNAGATDFAQCAVNATNGFKSGSCVTP